MESPLLLDRPSTQSWAGVPSRVDVPAMNSSFRTSHEVSSHETLVMQWAPGRSQNTCKIPNRLSACADLVSTCTSTFTSLFPAFSAALIHTRTPSACQAPLGNHFLTISPVSWILQKKKKGSNFLPPSLWRNPGDFKLVFFFSLKKKSQSQHSSAEFQANLFQLGSRNYICQQSAS